MQQRSSRRKAARRAQRRKRTVRILAAYPILLLVLAAAFIVWVYAGYDVNYERYQFDTSAMEGRIQTMTEAEIQAELNRVVEEGMFNISIASAIVFPGPGEQGQARIENVAANHYHMQVDITLDETGESVYTSNLIRPGYSIEFIRLKRRLPPGEYQATAMFSAITQEELQLFGQAAAQIKLYVTDEHGNLPTPTPQPAT